MKKLKTCIRDLGLSHIDYRTRIKEDDTSISLSSHHQEQEGILTKYSIPRLCLVDRSVTSLSCLMNYSHPNYTDDILSGAFRAGPGNLET